jgi:exodeoxyribonuclease V beta subunit
LTPPPLAARQFGGRINRLWRVSSFSSLAGGQESEHERETDDRPRIDESSLAGIHAFPRGARPGVCLHEIFESLDFGDAGAIETVVGDKLRQHDLYAMEHVSAVAACVRHTLAAQLGDITLQAVPMARTLRELEFHLPAARLLPDELSEATAIGLQFEPQRGVLKGFIDLIFEDKGRFHIVDWKSNWLGPTETAYTPTAMSAEMERHRYGLQWRLYMLALHRYLSIRLPDYTPAQHLGDVFYLFIRGITLGQPELGIIRAVPNPTELAKLDHLFSAR